MSTKSVKQWLPLWQKASEQEMGLVVECPPEDQAELVKQLYAARQAEGKWDGMIIMQPQPAGTLYIMHKSVELP